MFAITTRSHVFHSLIAIILVIIAATIIAHTDVGIICILAMTTRDAVKAYRVSVRVMIKPNSRLIETIFMPRAFGW